MPVDKTNRTSLRQTQAGSARILELLDIDPTTNR